MLYAAAAYFPVAATKVPLYVGVRFDGYTALLASALATVAYAVNALGTN